MFPNSLSLRLGCYLPVIDDPRRQRKKKAACVVCGDTGNGCKCQCLKLNNHHFSLVWNLASGPLVQFSSVTQSCPTLCNPMIAAHQTSLFITNSQSSLKLMSIKSVMTSSHLILCRPLLLLPPIPPSIKVFSNESTLRMRWPNYWSFSFSIIPSKEHPGLISFFFFLIIIF